MGLGRSAFPPTGPQGQGPCSLKRQVASLPQLPSPVKGGPMKQSTQGTLIPQTSELRVCCATGTVRLGSAWLGVYKMLISGVGVGD